MIKQFPFATRVNLGQPLQRNETERICIEMNVLFAYEGMRMRLQGGELRNYFKTCYAII